MVLSRVTIYDVAKKAGCSPATVSLVLNQSNLVKEETRKKVLSVIEELEYIPNSIAKSLKTQCTKTIGLIIPDVENPVYAKMISGIEEEAQKNRYDIILGISNEQSERENFYIKLLSQKRVDGVIIFPTHIGSVNQSIKDNNLNNIPIVFCGSAFDGANISYVKADNRLGAYKAVDHLLNTGRKKIGCIFPVVNKRQYISRLEGYKKALLEHGVDYDESLIKICSIDNESIFNATKELLTSRPDGIFCLYDYATIIVIKAVMTSKLSIPEDISVIGYDNIEISKFFPISLSTIDTNSKEVGRLSAEILIKQIEEHSPTPVHMLLEPELIVRESTTL